MSTSTSVMIQVLAVFYSVLIAFVIVGERSAISEANDHVAAEAGAMSERNRGGGEDEDDDGDRDE